MSLRMSSNAYTGVVFSSYQYNETIFRENSKVPRVGEEPNQARSREVLEFLDTSLERYGPRSAAFISLGSWVWPIARPEIIDYIIKSLLALVDPLPFVFTLPAKEAHIEPELVKQVEQSGRGIFTNWAPQVKVLQHEATGMFLVSILGHVFFLLQDRAADDVCE